MNEFQEQSEYQSGPAAAPQFPAPVQKSPSLALIIIINAVLSIVIAVGVNFLFQNIFNSQGAKIADLEKQVIKNAADIEAIGAKTKFINIKK